MDNLYNSIHESIAYLKEFTSMEPKTAIVLGTGLGRFAEDISDKIEIPYKNIPHFPTATVESHSGTLIFGYKSGHPIVAMSGRFHYYEGYSAAQLTFPIRVLHALGVSTLILTNAAGGVNPHFREGDIVMIKDHINMMPDHPLRGPNDERLGPRFPDMLHAYAPRIRASFIEISNRLSLPIQTGVYLGLQGPSLETPAEYKMAHILGADLVGMSTIPEVIVANHCGLEVAAFSIVSNVCFPESALTMTTIEEVIKVVNNSATKLQALLDAYFEGLT